MTFVHSASTPRSEFAAGLRDTFPLLVGSLPFGLIFGALAVSSGLSAWHALGMSLLVFAGSSQFIAVGLIGGAAALPVIVLTTFVVNLRHMLYSVTLAPHVRHLPQRWLLPLAFWLTDESFVVVARHYDSAGNPSLRHWYFLASCIAMYSNWFFWTLVGVLAGQRLPNAESWGLDFAMSVTFIGMIVPALKSRSMLAAALSAALVALLTNGLPNKFGLILAALVGVVVGMVVKPYDRPAHKNAGAASAAVGEGQA